MTAIIGPSGCGKSTLISCVNRMHEVASDVSVTGTVLVGDLDIYGPDVDLVELRRRVGMVFQKPNPFPKSIFDNVAFGPRLHGVRPRATPGRDRRAQPAAGGALGRGAGPAGQQRPRALGRPAAAALHRPRARRRARGGADGRAVLGARSDRHRQDRGADPRAQEQLHDRHRDPQHAAGGARLGLHRLLLPRPAGRVRRARRRSSPRPRKKQTEDYITGRFG